MSLNPMSWFKAKAQPIQLNPGSADMLGRHAGRLANLYAAQQAEPRRVDIAQEIEQRKVAIEAHGHDAPMDENQARALLAKVKG